MKKALLVLFIAVNVFTFCKSFSQTPAKADKVQQLKDEGIIDTLIIRKKEVSLTKKFNNNYQRDERVISAMSPDFVKDIVSPINIKNKHYKDHLIQGKAALDTVKAAVFKKIIAKVRWKKKFSELSGDSLSPKKYTIVQIPVYYLTPNIALFKDGENIAKYYNLERDRFKYVIIKNGSLFGMIDYYHGETTFIPASKGDSIGYDEILKLGKTPIAFKNFIAKDPRNVGGNIEMFGYLLHDHIIFSIYYEQERRTVHLGVVIKTTFTKTYRIELAESFFASGKGYPIIKQFIDSSYGNLRHLKKE